MKIAVIEDEKPIREGLVHILNKISPEYQVVGSAENGAEGLILLEEEMPDLIMLDIQMPDMDGLQMLKEARARGIYTKVIILTAYSDFSYAKKAIELGIENYLLKPVNLTELKKTLEKIKEELFVEQRGKNSLSLEKILKDILDGEYEKNERLDAVLADNYGIIQGHSLYCMYIFLGKYYESEKKEVGLFLEELKEHNPERKLCWLSREKQQAALVCFYGEEDVSKLLKYVKHSVVPACSVRLHDRGVFTWKECKGLNRLTETELELEKACGWHLILGDRVLIECEKILQMRTYQFIYPAELENRARRAVIHMNAEEFTGCFQKFMKYGRIEVHSPQELREVCIRFAYAIINTAKECGTLRDEELMVQRVLKTILGAVSWEEIEAVMMELFSRIEISQINQTSSEYLVQKALTIMKECYSDGITLEETARRLHVTEQYLGTQLKKETGTSFTETVRKFKIMHVKELLLDTDLKLNQIAAMTGFSNPKYMSKVFKQEEGMLPNEYRRINA